MKAVEGIGIEFLGALVSRMHALGLNQSGLAQRMNCSRSYVSKVFTGDVDFSFSTASRFCQALGMVFMPEMREDVVEK